MESFKKEIIGNYTFNPVPPIEVIDIRGVWDDYNTELDIELSNGDKIDVYYEGHGMDYKLDVFKLKVYNGGDTLICTLGNEYRDTYMDYIGEWGSIEMGVLKMYEVIRINFPKIIDKKFF
jgi:hypothetical protein